MSFDLFSLCDVSFVFYQFRENLFFTLFWVVTLKEQFWEWNYEIMNYENAEYLPETKT